MGAAVIRVGEALSFQVLSLLIGPTAQGPGRPSDTSEATVTVNCVVGGILWSMFVACGLSIPPSDWLL